MRLNDLRRKTSVAPHQQGVVLIITLIVLIAMTLAAIALVRSVDTSNVVAGNLAFKQATTQAADIATEGAITWLQGIAGSATSYTDDPANGYYATSLDLDMTGNGTDPNRYLVDWEDDDCGDAVALLHCKSPIPTAIPAGNGFEAKYIIHRLCQYPQSPTALGPPPNNCATTASFIPGTPRGELKYGMLGLNGMVLVEFYRITTRVKGPHNSLSYTETLVHF